MAKKSDAVKKDTMYDEYLSDQDKQHLARVEALTNLMIKHKIPYYKQGDYVLKVELQYHEPIQQVDLKSIPQSELDMILQGEVSDEELFRSAT